MRDFAPRVRAGCFPGDKIGKDADEPVSLFDVGFEGGETTGNAGLEKSQVVQPSQSRGKGERR